MNNIHLIETDLSHKVQVKCKKNNMYYLNSIRYRTNTFLRKLDILHSQPVNAS